MYGASVRFVSWMYSIEFQTRWGARSAVRSWRLRPSPTSASRICSRWRRTCSRPAQVSSTSMGTRWINWASLQTDSYRWDTLARGEVSGYNYERVGELCVGEGWVGGQDGMTGLVGNVVGLGGKAGWAEYVGSVSGLREQSGYRQSGWAGRTDNLKHYFPSNFPSKDGCYEVLCRCKDASRAIARM